MPACFLMRDQIGVDLDARGDREELGGVGIGETVIGIYCRKKKYIFSKRKKSSRPPMKTQFGRCGMTCRGEFLARMTGVLGGRQEGGWEHHTGVVPWLNSGKQLWGISLRNCVV